MVIYYIVGMTMAKYKLLEKIGQISERTRSRTAIVVLAVCTIADIIIDPIDFYTISLKELLESSDFITYPTRVAIGFLISISFIVLFQIHYKSEEFLSKWGCATLGFYMLHAPFIPPLR